MGPSTKIVYLAESGRISRVPKQSGKMNHRERAICLRVKHFREVIKWPQRDFAEQIGITLNQLASIEYGRTPLSYLIAWRMREKFGVSLLSLLEDGFPINEDDPDPWPSPSTVGNRSLLTKVFSEMNRLGPDVQIAADVLNKMRWSPHLPPPEYMHRAAWLKIIQGILKWAIAAVPDESVITFSQKVISAIEENLKQYPKDSESNIAFRFSELSGELMRSEIARRLLRTAATNSQNKGLTKWQTCESIPDVKNLWPELKLRLKSVTKKAGKKSELANFLKVDLTMVSRWLSDKDSTREPGAEYTLRMLKWVELQEGHK